MKYLFLVTCLLSPLPIFAWDNLYQQIEIDMLKNQVNELQQEKTTSNLSELVRLGAIGKGKKSQVDEEFINDVDHALKDADAKTFSFESKKVNKQGESYELTRVYDNKRRLRAEHSTAKDGEFKSYYPSGRLHRIAMTRYGKAADGVVRTYYESGELFETVDYKNDLMNGEKRWFYKNGGLLTKTPFVNGKATETTSYYEDGRTPASKFNFSGENNFVIRKFDPDGDLQYVDTFRNNVKVNRKAYDKEGRLKFNQDY